MNILEAKRWLTYAQSDLDAARVLLQSPESYPRQVCFLAQQAAEKSLKAILVLLELRFPYTHDLDHLREIIPPGWRVKETFPKLYELSIWAIDARCPDDMPDVVEADAQEALQLAKAVHQTILDDIKERGVQLYD